MVSINRDLHYYHEKFIISPQVNFSTVNIYKIMIVNYFTINQYIFYVHILCTYEYSNRSILTN